MERLLAATTRWILLSPDWIFTSYPVGMNRLPRPVLSIMNRSVFLCPIPDFFFFNLSVSTTLLPHNTTWLVICQKANKMTALPSNCLLPHRHLGQNMLLQHVLANSALEEGNVHFYFFFYFYFFFFLNLFPMRIQQPACIVVSSVKRVVLHYVKGK